MNYRDRLAQYEIEKAKIQLLNLSSKDYEKEIKKIALKYKI